MDLRMLECFVAVAEELHFGRAAARLHLSQPPLSRRIRALEEELGAALLARTSRRVELTPAGAALLEEARELLRGARSAAERVRRVARGEEGGLRVGFVTPAMDGPLPRVLRAFAELLPGVRLELMEMGTLEQLEALRTGRLDAGYARLAGAGLAAGTGMTAGMTATAQEAPDAGSAPTRAAAVSGDCAVAFGAPGAASGSRALPEGPDGAPLRAVLLLREDYVLALPSGHRLAARGRVDLAELDGEPLVGYPRGQGPVLHDAVFAALAKAGARPAVAQEVRTKRTALALVAAGAGLALVPRSSAEAFGRGVVVRPLGPGLPRLDIHLLHRAASVAAPLPGPLDRLAELTRAHALVRGGA
ncbi:MAG: LysR family transcriptional regulator [Desulfovibrionaceae bacterium]|jgi:DNA-binding transcriptional LysR family regulator|nr:LysR family transcriptional regulator [Desulfovibrionaceae bacterium]